MRGADTCTHLHTHTHTYTGKWKYNIHACMTFRLKLWGKWSLCGRGDALSKRYCGSSPAGYFSFHSLLTLFLSFFQQGSQDSAGGQEGLVPPPFSAFPPPPPPPPQNGLALDYGGSLYAAGAVQGPVEAGGAANSAANAANSLSVQVSASLFLCVQPTSGLCVERAPRARVWRNMWCRLKK